MMLNFLPIDENIIQLKDYFKNAKIEFCDVCVGTRYLWRKEFKVDYAIFDDTLILKETAGNYSNAFYYPIGKNEIGALEQIENYCKETGTPLLFCCIDNFYALKLAERYQSVDIFNDRAWSDYIYSASDLITLKGKKFSGKRNHVNKFKSIYPDYEVKDLNQIDTEKIDEFLSEYQIENLIEEGSLEKQELFSVKEYVERLTDFEQVGLALLVNDKIVGISAGEVLNDTLIVHVEKALKSYNGVYPTLANEFAKRYGQTVKKINREEDCGDMGLRIAKLQYHPIEIKQKNFVSVKTLFDQIVPPVLIKTERLSITDIAKSDEKDYYLLYTDQKLNEFWGYDYKVDCKEPNEQYFYEFQNELKTKKEEYSFAVRLNEEFIGELVLYNFGYFGDLEIGFRFFEKYHKKGYAFESANALITYAKESLGARKIKCRCYKQNLSSKKLIEKLGFVLNSQTDEKYFFVKE